MENIFPKFFSWKRQIFLAILMFLGESFLQPERKKMLKNVLTGQPYLAGPSIHKTGFLFFVALAEDRGLVGIWWPHVFYIKLPSKIHEADFLQLLGVTGFQYVLI